MLLKTLWTVSQIEFEIERIHKEISEEIISTSIGCGDEASIWLYHRDTIRVREIAMMSLDGYISESHMDKFGKVIKSNISSGKDYELIIYYSENKVLKFVESGKREELSEEARNRINRSL